MCAGCWKVTSPDRGAICNDTGAYLINYAGCKECGSFGFPKELDRVVAADENGEEMIEFEHVCVKCGHLIAKHHYSFSVDEAEGYQVLELVNINKLILELLTIDQPMYK
eukprot:TRINITY_DN11800_c1_g1_i1.p1 TRINITY_DN11800_c1_g1~~TRINITY_DN11800_c1_g1_i1.p1  ORF type:complete len:109 (-),score=12.56 TRINITY_DN11800_c1_g1_i1:9-335(-)